MKRFVLALVILSLLILACTPSELDADPTPTMEVNTLHPFTDCQLIELDYDEFKRVNENYCLFDGSGVVISEIPLIVDGDRRQWDRLNDYEIYIDVEKGNKGPWVFYQELGNINHVRGLRMEIEGLSGSFGYRQNDIYLQGGKPYIIKFEGFNELSNAVGAVANLDAYVNTPNSNGLERLNLRRQIKRTGSVEELWVVVPDEDMLVDIVIAIDLLYPAASGAVTWQGFIVMEAPDLEWGSDIAEEIN